MPRSSKTQRYLYLQASPTGSSTELLIGAGCVKVCEGPWQGHEGYGLAYNFNRLIKEGSKDFIQMEETTSSVFLRLYAAAIGLPFIPTLIHKGTDVINPEFDTLKELRGKDPKIAKRRYVEIEDPFWEGNSVLLIPAAKPDVSIIHVQEVGEEGTVRISGPVFGDVICAAAAKYTIVTAEKIVTEEYLRQNTSLNTIPGEYVDAIVQVPWGCHPSTCYGFYDTDPWFYKELVASSKTKEAFQEWLEKWVFGVADQEEYVKKLNSDHLKTMTADPAYGYNPKWTKNVK